MAKIYLLSRNAENDFAEIYAYSLKEFGEVRADAYRHSLKQCAQNLAETPQLGHRPDRVGRNYFRFLHQNHAIYYTVNDDGIFIVRILHGSRDVERHV